MRIVGSVALIALGLMSAAHAQGFTIKMSGDVVIPVDTVHEGIAMTMNGRIQIDGTLRGDAITMNGDVAVSGTVTGSVRTFNGNVTLFPTARVEGDVTAVNGRVDQQRGAVVTGQVSQGSILRTEPQPQSPQPPVVSPPPQPPVVSPPPQPPVVSPPPPEPQPSRPEWWENWRWERRWPDGWARAFFTWATLGFIAVTALIALLFPGHLQRIANGLSATPGQAFVAGFAVWFALPVLAVALAISIIGIPVLVLLPLAVGALAIFGFAATSLLLGDRLGDAFRRETTPVIDTIIGAVVLGVLALVPGIGWLALFLAVTWGIGGAVLMLIPRIRRTPPAAPVS